MQSFLDDIWGVRPHHVSRGQLGYFDDLLSAPSAVEDLLRHVQPEPSTVRLVQGDQSREADSYRCADGTLDLARVQRDFDDGYTIVLNKLEQYARTIASFAHSLEVELNFPTQVNAYVTPPAATGFVPHYDPHDVLILQIGGAKRWYLYGERGVPPHAMQRQQPVVAEDLPTPTELRLTAGDVLYLPRGQVHAAETDVELSVHLTVGLHVPTLLTLLTHVLHRLSLGDDRLHDRLPPGYLDDPQVRGGLGERLRQMLAPAADPGAVEDGLDGLENILSRRGRCPPVGRAATAVELTAETWVMKYQPLYSRVVPVPGGVGLQFAQMLIRYGPDHEAALRFLSGSTEPFRVGDLPGLTSAQQNDLARALIMTGFLVPTP